MEMASKLLISIKTAPKRSSEWEGTETTRAYVVSDDGARAEMGDEDDDLLRAAEELGIDLSGVRATDGQAADEE